MSPTGHQTTAKIYQFPRRPAGPPTRLGPEAEARADARQRPILGVECGSGWYHERAIADGPTPLKP